jgi:hypothetical protein
MSEPSPYPRPDAPKLTSPTANLAIGCGMLVFAPLLVMFAGVQALAEHPGPDGSIEAGSPAWLIVLPLVLGAIAGLSGLVFIARGAEQAIRNRRASK